MNVLRTPGTSRGTRRRLRGRYLVAAALVAVTSLAAACSSSGTKSGGGGGSTASSSTTKLADTGTTVPTPTKPDFGGGAHATGTDVGLTSSTIRVGLIADVNNPVAPGIFKNNVTAVKAWASLVNANGGLAGRKVVVDFCDSQLDSNATTNCVIKQCQNDFALVGTAANTLNDLSDIDQCKNAQGKALGIANLAFVGFAPLNCDKDTFLISGMGSYCKTKAQNPQTYTVNLGDVRYFQSKYSDLHGIWVYDSDVPTVKVSLVPPYVAAHNAGIGKDGAGFYAEPSSAPQSALTPIIQVMKRSNSTYGYGGATAAQTVLLRREAQVQGVNSVKVWACNSGCYTNQFLQQGGSAVNGEYVQLTTLPLFSEYQDNPTLKAMVDKVGGLKNTDSNALYSFMQALLFQDAVRKAAATGTLNRATLFTALRNETAFDADGIIGPTNIATQTPSACDVLVQVVNGKFQRVYPSKPGTFDCTPSNLTTVKTDVKI